MKNKLNPMRQGDVLLIPVNKIPTNLKRTTKIVLARGEATGHHHSIVGENCTGFVAEQLQTEDALSQYVEIENEDGVDLVHQTHDPVHLPPGKYKSVIQSEYHPQELRNVRD